MKIGVDLDGVVFDFMKTFLPYFNHYFGRSLVDKKDAAAIGSLPFIGLSEWEKFHPSDMEFCSKEEEQKVFEAFEEEGGYLNLSVIPEARPSLFRLSKKHMIYYITARPEEVWGDTDRSLKTNGLLILSRQYITIHHSTRESAKWQLCQQYEIDVMIDDRIEYLQEIKRNCPNIKTILFRYTDNLKITSDPPYDPDFIATTWPEIEKYIESLQTT